MYNLTTLKFENCLSSREQNYLSLKKKLILIEFSIPYFCTKCCLIVFPPKSQTLPLTYSPDVSHKRE